MIDSFAMSTHSWRCLLELRPDRSIAAGAPAALCDAIRRGADLRVYTEWIYEEHVAPELPHPDPRHNGLLQEIIDMRETMLVDDRYVAGITTLRQPILPFEGFNPNAAPRTSFFMYGMDGQQACANVMLDGAVPSAAPGQSQIIPGPGHGSKMQASEANDAGTRGPSRNFIYDFEVYRYFVRDDWTPILAHDANGQITAGSWEAFHEAHRQGREFKVGITNLCADLNHGSAPTSARVSHEVFTNLGSGWIHTRLKRYEVLTHPLVRVKPVIPMKYKPGGWDVAWIYLTTAGQAWVRSLNPYSRVFRDDETRLACRWFVR